MTMTGGCQCGAVRFRVDGELGEASICHCRMCQKAMGGLFGPFVGAPFEALVWTRGEPKRFQSSNQVRRGFCSDCGTPLTFEYGDRHVGDLANLPVHPVEEPKAAVYLAGIVSYQHPDHDTEAWEVRG